MKRTLSAFLLFIMVLSASSAWALTLYGPDADFTQLMQMEVDASADSEHALMGALVKEGVLPEGTSILSFAQEQAELTMDLSGAFGAALRGTGTAGEQMYMGSLVNSFLDAYDAQGIVLTCEGAPLETGHSVYDGPISRYDVGAKACIRLAANATTGYAWSVTVEGDAQAVSLVSDDYVNAPNPDDLVGVDGTQQYIFEAGGQGSAVITLQYARPWENVPPIDERFYIATTDENGRLTLARVEKRPEV